MLNLIVIGSEVDLIDLLSVPGVDIVQPSGLIKDWNFDINGTLNLGYYNGDFYLMLAYTLIVLF